MKKLNTYYRPAVLQRPPVQKFSFTMDQLLYYLTAIESEYRLGKISLIEKIKQEAPFMQEIEKHIRSLEIAIFTYSKIDI